MSDTSLPTADDLPDALLDREQWLCWREQERDGKATKVPLDPHTGTYASATDPETWGSFTIAREYAIEKADGIGFAFTADDPLVGVDLDDCRVPETGTELDWASDIVERVDSYTEVSPSGTGFHVIASGSLPDGRNRKGDIEVYETARFFTVTGDHVSETPTAVCERTDALAAVHDEYVADDLEASDVDDGDGETTHEETVDTSAASDSDTSGVTLADEEVRERAVSAANGEKFARLWNGSTVGYDSHSEADMALCSLLAFWTGGDANQMDRLFRESGLRREKWDEVHFSDGSTYGEKTIERAIAGTDEFYSPSADGTGDSSVNAGQSAEEQSRPVEVMDGEETATVESDGTETVAVATDVEGKHLEAVERMATELRELDEEVSALRERERELEAALGRERERREAVEAELAATTDRSFVERLQYVLDW